ncbi:MAG TPA: hypothetical protein VKB38_24990 [Terracidiphilus sp.]|nr:hypothetical protein [Terracidiphilus sp.]
MTRLNSFIRRTLLAAAMLGFLLLQLPANAAPLNSNTSSVTLTASLAESLTISTTVSSVTFNLVNGSTVTGSAGVPITTSWVLGPSRTSVILYGSFASSTAALTDSYTTPDNIPSADVLGQVTTGTPTTYTAFSQTNSGFGAASASLLLFNQAISSTNANFVSNRSDTLNLEIATPASLPAGTYTGTLTLQAQAN